jgi:hypothetical protein
LNHRGTETQRRNIGFAEGEAEEVQKAGDGAEKPRSARSPPASVPLW